MRLIDVCEKMKNWVSFSVGRWFELRHTIQLTAYAHAHKNSGLVWVGGWMVQKGLKKSRVSCEHSLVHPLTLFRHCTHSLVSLRCLPVLSDELSAARNNNTRQQLSSSPTTSPTRSFTRLLTHKLHSLY